MPEPSRREPRSGDAPAIRVRPAAPGDHARIVAVLDDWWGGRAMTDMLPRLFLDHFGSTSLVAVTEDGSLAGFLVGFLSRDQVGTAYVHFAGVGPEYRRGGLAARLYGRFFAMASAAGATSVKAVTSPINEVSQRFHRALGFDVSEPVADYDGAGSDRVVMTRALSTSAPSASGAGIGEGDSTPEAARFVPLADPRPRDGAWREAAWPPPPDIHLGGATVTLTPASSADAPGLFDALDHDAAWSHVRGRPAQPQGWVDRIERSWADGWHPWVLRLAAPVADRPVGTIVGTSSYLEVASVDARLEIGFTVYDPAVWGSSVNPEAKLLLLGYAFDELGMGRVQLKTDIRNVRSQQAIARLGARFEGVLRRYQRRSEGSVRDTVLFSITAEEWPAVRDGLRARLGQ
jgi:N-acetyltransferase